MRYMLQCEDMTNLSSVRSKGLASLIEYSGQRKNDKLLDYLKSCQQNQINMVVHKECRRNFTNARRSEVPSVSTFVSECEANVLRSSTATFQWKENCVFCDEKVIADLRHPDRNRVFHIRTLPFKENILKVCESRNDHWAMSVQRRILSCIDLVASEAIYHRDCHSRFLAYKDAAKAGEKKNWDASG